MKRLVMDIRDISNFGRPSLNLMKLKKIFFCIDTITLTTSIVGRTQGYMEPFIHFFLLKIDKL